MAIYSTTAQQGIDVNAVFYLDPGAALEYPSAPFLPGELAWGTDGSEFVFCTASIAIPAGAAVLISPTPGSWSVALVGGATVATAPFGQLVGVVGGATGQVSVTAPTGTQTASYFWVQRAGNVPNLDMIGTGTTLLQLHSSATQGGALNAAAGGAGTSYQVNGIVWSVATASAAGPNTAIANYPAVGVTN